MAVNADTLNTIIEMVKQYFHDLIKPDMTIEKMAEVASPNLDKIIKKNAEQGLKYKNGKFKINYLDDKHFSLAFEMYFKDDAGKWYTAKNESEPRDAELIEAGSWKTLKALKVVEFPIGAPAASVNDRPAAEKIESKPVVDEPKTEPKTESKDEPKLQEDTEEKPSNDSDKEITLDKLMDAKK